MTGFRSEKGITLLELTVSLAVAAILFPTLVWFILVSIREPPRMNTKLTATRELETASFWLLKDARSAETFTSLSEPQYGYFSWTDFTGGSSVEYKATYYYEEGELRRKLEANGVVESDLAIALNIAEYGDVSFQWFPSERYVYIDIKSTAQEPGSEPISASAGIIAALRPLAEPIVSPPGPTPTPTPVGYVYYVGADPIIQLGTYISGNLESLHDVDSDYYVVRSVKSETYEKIIYAAVESETMTLPSTIGDVEVRFTGMASKKDTSVQFFVQNTPDTEVILTPTADTFAAKDESQRNFGSEDRLEVRSYKEDSGPKNRRSFLRFDLSSIPPGALVKSATLRLYMYEAPAASRYYETHRITEDWDELTLNWKNQPKVTEDPTATISTGTTSGTWVEWDVTSDVRAFVWGMATNYGWRVRDDDEKSPTDQWARFRSREFSNTDLRPQLVVRYATFPSTPDSGFTFPERDQLLTHSFSLDAEALSFVNNSRKVVMKIEAINTPNFTLSTDQIIFIANPP